MKKQVNQEMTREAGGEADSLRREDLIDLRPRAEVLQEELEGRLGKDIRLDGVKLKRRNMSSA